MQGFGKVQDLITGETVLKHYSLDNQSTNIRVFDVKVISQLSKGN